jgi:ER-bound oxygenase mpaB/B'/Rubber oxygenase, catalytic domain
MVPSRFTQLDDARARFGDRVDRLGPWLLRSDEPADAVVRCIARMPAGRGWALFTEAAARGVANVTGAPDEMRALFTVTESVPPWVDWPTLERGGRVLMRAGLLGGLVLGLSSLPHGYASPGGNKPLVFSGRMQDQAVRRLNETARFVQAVCRPDGMRPGADGYQITLRVRLMHAQVRHMLLASGKWDAGAWGQPINQHDMAATTLLFSLVLLDGLRKLGARVTADDAEAYMQLWRYTGLVMGVDPGILPTGEAEGRRLADLIRATTAPPDEDGRALTRSLLTAPLGLARSARERAVAEKRVDFSKALCRELMGDELAEHLGVERTRWRLTVPILRRVVATAERIRGSVPGADRTALTTGTRYWDRVVEVGLAGVTAEFKLPDRLAA